MNLDQLKASKRHIIESHVRPNDRKGLTMVLTTVLPVAALFYAMVASTDVSYWLGTVGGPATQLELLTNKTTSQLAGLGFGSRIDNDGNGDRSVTLNSPANGYNALLFGAKFDDDNDAFKIKSLTIDYAPGGPRTPETPVPEPASLVLMGCGLVGVASAVRRRRAARQ